MLNLVLSSLIIFSNPVTKTENVTFEQTDSCGESEEGRYESPQELFPFALDILTDFCKKDTDLGPVCGYDCGKYTCTCVDRWWGYSCGCFASGSKQADAEFWGLGGGVCGGD